jgi:MarR family 2-MHQ and catechol resistance regulon transcriptional repressor
VVDKLEKKGFVERLPIPGDRRKTNVTLTVEGRSYFDNIFPNHVQTISANLSFVTDEEKLELIELLKKIGYGIKGRQG